MAFPLRTSREILLDLLSELRTTGLSYTHRSSKSYALASVLSREIETAYAFFDSNFDRAFLDECLTFIRNKVGKPEAMEGRKDDRIMAKAIALEIRKNAPSEFEKPADPYIQTNEQRIMARLEFLKKGRNKEMISQDAYI